MTDPAGQGAALPVAIERSAQGDGDLGERMARAAQRVTTELGQPVLRMGTDCPALTAARIRQAGLVPQLHDIDEPVDLANVPAEFHRLAGL